MKNQSVYISALFILIITSCEFDSGYQVEIISSTIQLTQNTSFDINAPNVGPPIRFAKIKGQIQNKGEKTVKNIVITYKFPRGTVTSKIPILKPGQKINFVTNTYNSRYRNPDYKLDSITYDIIE